MHEQWEPRPRKRVTGTLLSILSYRFTRDAQAAIGAFDRCVREREGHSTHAVPDYIKARIVTNGVEEQSLRDHIVMHSARIDSNEKLKLEVFDVARAKSGLGQPDEG